MFREHINAVRQTIHDLTVNFCYCKIWADIKFSVKTLESRVEHIGKLTVPIKVNVEPSAAERYCMTGS